MTESGVAPFSTTLLFDAGSGTIAEPMAVLMKEALAPLGITVELSKIPGANFRGELNKKTAPMVINRFGGWLDWPDYYFFWNYHGQNSIFDIPSYQNPAMDKLIDAARFAPDEGGYAQNVRGFVDARACSEVPSSRSLSPSRTWRCRRPSAATSTGPAANPTSAT